jgi:outer membrane protein assembly factor BamE (lipoprotein component of BamABCDE complex)
MDSIKGRRNCSRKLALTALLTVLIGGCSIGRVYMGSEIRNDPKEKIQIGSTTKSEVLEIFGPPDRIQQQFDGDIFVYAYLRKNSTKLAIEEPYFTKFTLFSYTKVQQKSDLLVILFDKDGVVKNYGFQRDTSELSTL